MPSPPRYCTDDLPQGAFRLHGRVEFELEHPLLRTRAVGPFNKELVEALSRLVPQVFREMSVSGPWMELVQFEESMLAAPEVMQGFTAVLGELARQGLVARATAHVLNPEVEGTTVMAPLFAQAYAKAGLRYAHFTSEEEARAWLDRSTD